MVQGSMAMMAAKLDYRDQSFLGSILEQACLRAKVGHHPARVWYELPCNFA